MKIHELKIRYPYFKDICSEKKTFEVRKDDRNFELYDYLLLKAVEEDFGYTGDCCLCKIVYILRDAEFVKKGYVILGIRLLDEQQCLPF